MKLTKKNAARQRAIAKALAAGKALGGLLAGLAACALAGCREHSPASTMGRYPAPRQSNADNEKSSFPVPGEPPEVQPEDAAKGE